MNSDQADMIGRFVNWDTQFYLMAHHGPRVISRRAPIVSVQPGSVTVRLSRYADYNCPKSHDGELLTLENGKWRLES